MLHCILQIASHIQNTYDNQQEKKASTEYLVPYGKKKWMHSERENPCDAVKHKDNFSV